MSDNKEYKTARRNRLTPLQALEDWDLLLPEERALFEDYELVLLRYY